jgi:hypothetical protein
MGLFTYFIFLLAKIIFIAMSLLLIVKFKSPAADYLVILVITFLFCYLYLLISGLDDPFDVFNGETDVDLKPIDRFKQLLVSDFCGLKMFAEWDWYY